MFRHPFNNPGVEGIDRPDGRHDLFAPPVNQFAVVLTVETVTGGQRITWQEQIPTDRSNATPKIPSNPANGEAMIPSGMGSVSVGSLVMLYPMPGQDQLLAVPAVATVIAAGGGYGDLLLYPPDTAVVLSSALPFPSSGTYQVWATLNGRFRASNYARAAMAAFLAINDATTNVTPAHRFLPTDLVTDSGTSMLISASFVSLIGYAIVQAGDILRLCGIRYTLTPAPTWYEASVGAETFIGNNGGWMGYHKV